MPEQKRLTLAQRHKKIAAIKGRYKQMSHDFSDEIETGKFVRLAVTPIVEEYGFMLSEIERLQNRIKEAVEAEIAKEGDDETPEVDPTFLTSIPAAK